MIFLLMVAQDLPEPPAGWKIEVVATAPAVRHPTVVACAPDGRVFVGEDPMDISAPAHEAKGRILCFHPDGRVTVFAEGLYAPFGLLYLEGRLYVNHAPRFSVFTDDGGVGKDRVDLIESTNPNPWALDWNDHVPANFRLAMDGYFYMSVGDKGIYGAVGRDGRRADLHGGGILRLRPDATQLEVISTGTRNHLDVALDAEDEVFTYDNTDEKDWWSRLTHMVEGGTYAYPWEHKPRRPWTLWMMGEYGGGAATGGLAYLEDALPEEYRGDLFLEDYGKRQILRVKVAREGATYRIVSKQDFFSKMPGDFGPVGIAVSPDGMSFYVTDWKYAAVKAKVVVGQLLKVTYTGKSSAAPKPGWWRPAAMGRPFEATNEELIRGLSHPAQSVRMTAQRKLAERKAVEPLVGALRAGGVAARHAVWALDAIGAGRPAILEALRGDARLQAARQLGTRRAPEAFGAMVGLLKDPDAAMRFRAATALGRMGKAGAVPALVEALEEPDLFARYAVFTALNRIGRADPAAWAEIVRGLEHPSARVREGAVFAVRETFDATLVEALGRVKTSDAVEVLGGLHRKVPAWKGEWWAYHPVDRPRPAKTVEWEGTARVLGLIRAGLEEAGTRRAAVGAVREARDAESLPRLRALFPGEKDLETRRAILETCGALKDAKAGELVAEILGRSATNPPELVFAIRAAGEIGAKELLKDFLRLRSERPDARMEAIEALGRMRAVDAAELVAEQMAVRDPFTRQVAVKALRQMRGETAALALTRALEDPDLDVRKAAIAGLGELRYLGGVPHLLGVYSKDETRFEAAEALARIPDARALEAYLWGIGSTSPSLREACRKAVGKVAREVVPEIERRLEAKALAPAVIGELQQVISKERSPRLHEEAVKKADPEAYLDFAIKNRGDAARGRTLFADAKGPACAKCHKVQGEGGEVGPDLSTIGAQFARKDLAEGVLWPSRKVREGYQQVVVRTKDGSVVSGAVKSESAQELALLDAEGRLHAIRKSEIEQRKTSELSLMPEGVQAGLSLPDFADLISYLESLR